MQKKTCETCGKTWIVEKFDVHLCIALPPKPRRGRAAAPRAETKTETKQEGPPLIAFRRNS